MSNFLAIYVVALVLGIIGTYLLIKHAVQSGVEAALSKQNLVKQEVQVEKPMVSETSEPTEQKFTETAPNQLTIAVGVILLVFILAIAAS